MLQRNLDVISFVAFDRLEDAFSLGVIYGGNFEIPINDEVAMVWAAIEASPLVHSLA